MHRLVYTSTATRLLKKDELHKLLNSARTYNSAEGITGILIYHEGCFLQVLEGDKDVIERCYKRIRRDGRHSNYIELANEATTGRLFSDWWMAYREMGQLGNYQQKQFVELQCLAAKANDKPLVESLKVNAILLAFMSTFRDLEMTA